MSSKCVLPAIVIAIAALVAAPRSTAAQGGGGEWRGRAPYPLGAPGFAGNLEQLHDAAARTVNCRRTGARTGGATAGN